MRPPKINPGNAEDVIQRGRNITIVPRSGELVSPGSRRKTSVRLTGYGMFVVNGGPQPNPDEIPVNESTYPGWKIEEYNCAFGSCATFPAAPDRFVEVVYDLPDNWTNAYLVVEMAHAGATPDEMLFRVVSAKIVDDGGLSFYTFVNMSYSLSTGEVDNTVGAYYIQLATTDTDGTRILTSQMREGSWMSADVGFQNQEAIDALRSPLTAQDIVRLDGVFLPEDFYNMLTPSIAFTGNYFYYTLTRVP